MNAVEQTLNANQNCAQTQSTKRLQILQESLRRKEEDFDNRLSVHFDTVKKANGQPLNDKRNGSRTLALWERQNDALRSLDQGIEKTKAAIEREQAKIGRASAVTQELPQPIIKLIEDGTLTQWRKYPNRFFVKGVEKGRIIWNLKKNTLLVSHYREIPDREQFERFKCVFNALKSEVKNN